MDAKQAGENCEQTFSTIFQGVNHEKSYYRY
jgi:hypothetical protein